MSSNKESNNSNLTLRSPTIDDARKIWRLVGEAGVMDQNSCYLYLLLCRDFSETCLVAEIDSQLVGFVTAYRPPHCPDVLFVWQIGVSPVMRRQRLAVRMLRELLSRCRSGSIAVRYIEATVSPSNLASRGLFESWARELGVPLCETRGFTEEDFPEGDHESEPRLRLGPLCE